MEKPTADNDSYRLQIGELGSFTVAPVYGNDPATPQKVLNPVYPFPASEVTVGSATGQFGDHDKELTLENNSGEISEFILSGS